MIPYKQFHVVYALHKSLLLCWMFNINFMKFLNIDNSFIQGIYDLTLQKNIYLWTQNTYFGNFAVIALLLWSTLWSKLKKKRIIREEMRKNNNLCPNFYAGKYGRAGDEILLCTIRVHCKDLSWVGKYRFTLSHPLSKSFQVGSNRRNL